MWKTMMARPGRWIGYLKSFWGQRETLPSGDATASIPENLPEEDESAETARQIWKDKALADFKDWLEALPDFPAASEGVSVDSCDLYTLLTEFTALRQEIRMQNREQHRSLKALESASGNIEKNAIAFQEASAAYRRAVETVDDLTLELRAATEEMRRSGNDALIREAEKRMVTPFLDIRDALARGLTAAHDANRSYGFFRKPPREMAGVITGYEMAIRRFDRALLAVNIRPLATAGKVFDAKTMRAVETRNRPDLEKGVVVEELSTGFVRGDDIIRTAEVVVNV